jgi:hypothetical protein
MSLIIFPLLFSAALLVLISSSWKVKLLALLGQYLIVVFLVGQSWPLGLSAVKGIAGLMSVAILAYTQMGLTLDLASKQISTGRPFKLFAFILVAVLVFSIAPRLITWIPGLSLEQSTAGLLLFGAGIIHVALDSRILPTITGLLTLFAGFELIYSVVEISTLLAGLLALINLGIALVGAFLLLLPSMEPVE